MSMGHEDMPPEVNVTNAKGISKTKRKETLFEKEQQESVFRMKKTEEERQERGVWVTFKRNSYGRKYQNTSTKEIGRKAVRCFVTRGGGRQGVAMLTRLTNYSGGQKKVGEWGSMTEKRKKRSGVSRKEKEKQFLWKNPGLSIRGKGQLLTREPLSN